MATISDRKIGIDLTNNGIADFYDAEVSSLHDYYPFGMEISARSFLSNTYKYGFNGMEKDDELKGEGNSYHFGANNPILFIDENGDGPGDAEWFKLSFGFTTLIARHERNIGFYGGGTITTINNFMKYVGMEGGARAQVNFYQSKWEQNKWGFDGSIIGFGGINGGNTNFLKNAGIQNSLLTFMGSGIINIDGGASFGGSQAYLFGSNIKRENINQRIGGFMQE